MCALKSSILKMTEKETIRFVELYESECVLWDPNDPKYKTREARDAAAKRIADKLQIPNFTAAQVVFKFKNLRSSYLQEIKKIKQSTKSGCSTDKVYVPKVVWFPIMDRFLRPHIKSRNTQSNFNHTITEDCHDDDVKQESCESIDLSPKREDSPHQVSGTLFDSPLESNNINLALKKLDEIARNAQTTLAHHQDDYLDYFGKYIVAMLREFPPDKCFSLQQQIMALVMKEKIATLEGQHSAEQDPLILSS